MMELLQEIANRFPTFPEMDRMGLEMVADHHHGKRESACLRRSSYDLANSDELLPR